MLHNIAYERILRIFAFFGFVAILVLFPFFLIFVAKMRPLDSVVAGMIAATIGGVIIAARGVRRPPTQDSSNETISQYQNQTRQIKDMKWVLLGAIIAGTLLMMITIVAPYLFIPLIHTYVVAQNTTFSNATIVDTIKTLSNAPKDVLPFATALAGFAGGVVTAMFRGKYCSNHSRH
jgi:Na+/glutamate symporter